MVNYTNSKVYKIWSPQGNNIYIGSTTKQYLSQRMDSHRSKYKSYKENKYHFITSFLIFEEYELDNCYIELLEAKECRSKDELIQLEGKFIRELNCVNKRVEGRTKQEYYQDNKDSIQQYKKGHYTDNKDKIIEKVKEYYESNKVKVLERQNKKYDCICGKTYSYANKLYHLKTIKHCQHIESLKTSPEGDLI
jgi:hypothetical protein